MLRRGTSGAGGQGGPAGRWSSFVGLGLGLGLGLLSLASGCVRAGASGGGPRPSAPTGSAVDDGGGRSPGTAGDAAPDPTRLRSAVHTHAAPDPDPAGPAWREPGADEVILVFSGPLDPTSLAPGGFLLLDEDGRRWIPARAVLAPCHEADELRCVTLGGALGEGVLSRVQVIGVLVDARGHSLRGQDAAVEPPHAEPRLVVWELLAPQATRCDGSADALRLWWSRPVTPRPGLAPADAALVRAEDGQLRKILAIDDAELGEAPGQDPDPVIDLCLAAGGPVGEVEPGAGAFVRAPP